MPFVTEALWRRAAPLAGIEGDTVMLQPYPDPAHYPRDRGAEEEMAWVQAVILGVRQVRGQMDIAPGRKLALLLQDAAARDAAWLERHRKLLLALARLESAECLPRGAAPPPSATVLVGETKLLVPMAGIIDAAAEIARLEKQRARLEADLGRTRAKLERPAFVEQAPAVVVGKERRRAEELATAIANIEQQLERVRALA